MPSRDNKLQRRTVFGRKSATGKTEHLNISYVPAAKGRRFGVVVPKRVSASAVLRNKLKRRLRAVLGETIPLFPTGDYLIFLKKSTGITTDLLRKELRAFIVSNKKIQ